MCASEVKYRVRSETLYTSSPQKYYFFLPAFVTRLLTPRSRKSGHGLLLGCRSGLDSGPSEKTFFDDFDPKKPGNLHCLFWSGIAIRNRSGVVELVGREPLIFARVENGVTIFSPKRQKTPKKSKRNWIRNSSFQCALSVGNFHFLAAGKLTFWGGV